MLFIAGVKSDIAQYRVLFKASNVYGAYVCSQLTDAGGNFAQHAGLIATLNAYGQAVAGAGLQWGFLIVRFCLPASRFRSSCCRHASNRPSGAAPMTGG